MKTQILIGIIFLCSMTAASAMPPVGLQKKLDEFVKGGPGGVALAWVDADGIKFFQSGTYSGDDPRPVTPDTQFEIGSISKVFTALLLVETERSGKASRLDPVSKYLLPSGDPAQKVLAKITLLSLTTHTSGLPRLPSNISDTADSNDPYAAYDDVKLVAALRSDGPGAPVGQSFAYSNFGAALLGEALAAVWGTSYADALSVHVLTPLGLKATTIGIAGLPPSADLALGHAGGKAVPNWTFEAFAPAGALRSSTRDMAQFLLACLDRDGGSLRSAFDATLQPQFAVTEIGGHIGLGWFLNDDPQVPVAWHNGATAGSHAFVAFSRKTGTGVVILSNIQENSEALGFGLLGTKPPQPQIETIKNASDYIGRYPLTPTFAINITEVNGTLFGQATGQQSLRMHPIAPDRFAIMGVPAEISFSRDGAGKVTSLVLHQNGQDKPAPRGVLPPPPTEVAMPAETLRQYVGNYPLAPTFIITITEKEGALFAQATGQAKLPIFASDKDEFFYKIVDARISFQRDNGEKIVGLILRQGGRDMPAKKDSN